MLIDNYEDTFIFEFTGPSFFDLDPIAGHLPPWNLSGRWVPPVGSGV